MKKSTYDKQFKFEAVKMASDRTALIQKGLVQGVLF